MFETIVAIIIGLWIYNHFNIKIFKKGEEESSEPTAKEVEKIQEDAPPSLEDIEQANEEKYSMEESKIKFDRKKIKIETSFDSLGD